MEKMTKENMKDLTYPEGMTGEKVVTGFLSKTAFPSPIKLEKLDNADCTGKYDRSLMKE